MRLALLALRFLPAGVFAEVLKLADQRSTWLPSPEPRGCVRRDRVGNRE
jgi:hypothetical protein